MANLKLRLTKRKGPLTIMADREKPINGWNIFARELEAVLNAHNMRLGQLDDRLGIHQEKVRRLRQSLDTPEHFPVLNPKELELVEQKLKLSDEEKVHLRAAVLATYIERGLMDRIGRADALLAAEQIFPTIRDALLKELFPNTNTTGESGLGAVRADDDEAEDNDVIWISVWDALEAADHAMHRSYNVSSHKERVEQARYAYANYEEALEELESLESHIQSLLAWKNWHDEANRGLASVQARLGDLGEE
jgi:hypothetical protein